MHRAVPKQLQERGNTESTEQLPSSALESAETAFGNCEDAALSQADECHALQVMMGTCALMGLGVIEPGVCVLCLLSSHRLPWSHTSLGKASAPVSPHLFQVLRVGNNARLAQGEFFHLFSGHSFKASCSVISLCL